ncbi:MAG: ABC transporter permease [Candidatus Bathyarchaeota archaeon]|nr:ABC transporter permease [Candidatus Bathyarchaeota archaeon]
MDFGGKLITSTLRSLARFARGFLTYMRLNTKTMVGSVAFFSLIALAALEPSINYILLSGHSPTEMGLFERTLLPSFEHPLGTDATGRDLLSLVLAGLRFSMIIAVISGSVATLVAVSVAFLAGYKGGIYDHILRSVTDTILVIPIYPIAAIAAAYVRRIDLFTMSMFLAVLTWPWAARTIRAQILTLKEMVYVDLAKISGLSDYGIMFREILPNLLPFIVVGFGNALMGSLFIETGLRLIGLGPTEIMTLGMLVNLLINWGFLSLGRYSPIVVTTFLLVLIFVSVNLLNIGLDEVFNPRLKKVTGL